MEMVVEAPETSDQEKAAPTDAADGDVLHVVYLAFYPVAVCGYVVRAPWNSQIDTRGRDRCTECLRLDARGLGNGAAAADRLFRQSFARIFEALGMPIP